MKITVVFFRLFIRSFSDENLEYVKNLRLYKNVLFYFYYAIFPSFYRNICLRNVHVLIVEETMEKRFEQSYTYDKSHSRLAITREEGGG